MYTQSSWMRQITLLKVASAILLGLFALAACSTGGQPSQAGTNAGQVQSNSSATQLLPTPAGTPGQDEINARATQIALRVLATPVSLVNKSPEEIGQKAVAFAREHGTVRSGEPQVLLTRPVTFDQLTALGLGKHESETIEKPPLMMVILKGDFSPFPKPGAGEGAAPGQSPSQTEADRITYVAYVYDLWGGIPIIIQESKDGGIFKKALNDPALPDVPSLSPPSDPKRDSQPRVAKVLHYGDTGIGEPISGQVIHKASFGAWDYLAKLGVVNVPDTDGTVINPNQIYVMVGHNWNSPTGTQDYINANKQMLPQVAAQDGQVEISIVFNNYIPVEQFRAFVQAHKLRVGSSHLRAIDQNTPPIYAPYYTLQIKASSDSADPLPEADLNSKLASVNDSPAKQVQLKGVYATHAWVDAKELPTIAADPAVYYVDVTAEAARNDLVKAGISNARQAVVVNYAYVLFSAVEKPYQSK
jgi:hypothetical protein